MYKYIISYGRSLYFQKWHLHALILSFPKSLFRKSGSYLTLGGLTGGYTVMPLSDITVSLFPVWKWNRGKVLFNNIRIH
jgi:hypothetical protein